MSEDKEKTILEYVSDVTELAKISAFMEDPVVDEAMGYVVKLSVKNSVPGQAVAPLVVKLEALAGQCALKAKYYMVWSKTEKDAGPKKNTYLTLEDALHNLANAIKHFNKTGN